LNELLLEVFSFVFGKTFLDGFRCAVHHVLSFFQAKTSKFFHQFNDLKFISSGSFQNHIEVSFLSFSCATCTTSSRTSSNNCSSSGVDAVGFLQVRSEFSYFFYSELNKLITKCFDISHFCKV